MSVFLFSASPTTADGGGGGANIIFVVFFEAGGGASVADQTSCISIIDQPARFAERGDIVEVVGAPKI